jgi:uncharacterized protein (TIGR02118 family)
MHVLTFMYPTTADASFDFEHYFRTHLPLGAGLAEKFLELQVKRMIIQKVRGPAEGGVDKPFYVLCHVPFDTQEEVDKLATLFSYAEAAQRLSEDWPKYTPISPLTVLSEWTTLENMGELRAQFASRLEPEFAAQMR